MRGKITGKLIAAQSGPFVIRDTELRGFFARRQTDAGKITFGYRYADAEGKTREVKLGVAGPDFTPDQARTKGTAMAGDVARSADPAAARDAQRAMPTVAQAWEDYEANVLSKKRGRTPENYRSLYNKHIKPHVGDKRIDLLTPAAAEAMHKAITELGGKRDAKGHKHGGAVTANRALDVLSAICHRAMFREWISRNPCAGVERNPETPKDIRFSDAELSLIQKALKEEAADIQIAFGLFLETPVRHSNVASAEWAEFVDLDGDAPVWRIPGHKLKNGEPYEAHISPVLGKRIAAYRETMRALSPLYLFPREDRELRGREVKRQFDPDKPRLKFQSAWERIRDRALQLAGEAAGDHKGLKEGTVHTFKHTYLSAMADLGASASELQQMGQHADIRTSMGYVSGSRARLQELAKLRIGRLPAPAA